MQHADLERLYFDKIVSALLIMVLMKIWICIFVIDIIILIISGSIFADELNRGRFNITSLITFLIISSIHFHFDYQDFCIYLRNPPFYVKLSCNYNNTCFSINIFIFIFLTSHNKILLYFFFLIKYEYI